MHAMLTKGSPILMAADTEPGRQFQPAAGFSIVIACESLEEIQRLFVDQFGVKWMFNFDKPKPA